MLLAAGLILLMGVHSLEERSWDPDQYALWGLLGVGCLAGAAAWGLVRLLFPYVP